MENKRCYVEIIEVENRKVAVVLSKTYLRIEFLIKGVTEYLTSINFNGEVVFDLVMTNGLNTKTRFFKLIFNENEFDLKSLHNLKILHKIVLDVSNNYYKNNLELLDRAAMTNSQKEKFIESIS